jgi:excisionase family DNA binding protein
MGHMGDRATRQRARGSVKLLLTVPEAAEALGLGRSVVYELLVAGELDGVKIGRARRIPVRSLEKFVTRHMVTGRKERVDDTSRA